jgi:glycine cleavage system aminomethyltransferase T
MASATLTDHEVLTTACGLVDRSERGKLALTGDQAAELLNGQVTNDVTALEPGTGQYAAFLTPKGKMLGDLRILRTERELHLDCERPSLQGLFDLLRRGAIGWQAELHKRTVQEALLSLVGPRARVVAGLEALPAEEHACLEGSVAGIAVLAAARTSASTCSARPGTRRRCGRRSWRPGRSRCPRRRRRSCGSSRGGRGTAWTSTTRRSRRRRG